MQQLRQQESESKRADARLAMAESKHKVDMDNIRKAEAAKNALLKATSGYDWESLANPETWQKGTNPDGTIRPSAFSTDLPEYWAAVETYKQDMEATGQPYDELVISQRKDATDASFMSKKVSIFNSLVDKTKREKYAEGWSDSDVYRYVASQYGGEEMNSQYEALTSRLGPDVLPPLDYEPIAAKQPWLSSDLSKGKLTSWAFDPDLNEAGEKEGWSDMNLLGGGVTAATMAALAWKFPWLRGLMGKGVKETVKKGVKVKPKVPVIKGTTRVPQVGTASRTPLPVNTTNKPILYGRQGGPPIRIMPGQGGPTTAELLKTAANMGGGGTPLNKVVSTTLPRKIVDFGKAALPWAAPEIGGGIGEAIGGEDGRKLGTALGVGIMGKKVGLPAAKNFLGYIGTKFPKALPQLAKLNPDAKGGMLNIIGQLTSIGFTTSQVVNLWQEFTGDNTLADSLNTDSPNKKGRSKYHDLISNNIVQ